MPPPCTTTMIMIDFSLSGFTVIVFILVSHYEQFIFSTYVLVFILFREMLPFMFISQFSLLPGMSLNYLEINTESFLISLTSLLFSHLSHFSSSLLSFLFIVRSSLYSFPPGHEFNRSRNEHRIISESTYRQEIFCVPFVS